MGAAVVRSDGLWLAKRLKHARPLAKRAVGPSLGSRMSAQYYIAKTVNGREYVVLLDSRVVAGPFATAAEAVKAREALLEAGRVAFGDMTSERVANT
jgi:hypothetical protein